LEQINKLPIFVRQEPRDAYAAIRGFVYQVERTILAWLDLDEETALYCECGEDIDYVRQLTDPDLEESIEERLLEQVKYRQENALSLRSKEILEALVNFVIHKKSNPHHRLKMRFFTNATPAKEKGIPFPRGLSGLETWEQVRMGKYNPTETQTTIAYIRRVITESISVLPPNRTQSFIDFLSSADEQIFINELIIPVEWAMGSEDAQEMQPLIEAKIKELAYAKELSEAKEIFNRLFVHVFRIISSPGNKRLDKETLIGIIEKGTLVTADRELLKIIWALLKTHEEKIQAISSEVTSLRVGHQDLSKRVTEGFRDIMNLGVMSGVSVQPLMTPPKRPALDYPPPLPVTLAPREKLIGSILKMLKELSWVALTASTGMGKTQVARILLDHLPFENKFWISLRSISERIDSHINEQLLCIHYILSGDWKLWDEYHSGNITLQNIDESVAASVGSNSLLVIDNLPDLLQAGSLAQRLAALGKELRKVGGKVITTSQHKLPQEIINVLGSDVSIFDVPFMDEGDINALLVGAGVPTGLQRDTVYSYILGVTKGHPVLVASTVRWLSINGWKIDNFSTLLSGEPMQEARHETSKLTRQLISDVSTRGMLDRLSIVGVPFDAGMASVVGKTEPAIERPKEHFDELVGPWIQPLAKSQFEVSPLLQNLWQLYLEPDLQKRLHFDIAHEYLKKKAINANDAFQVCIHLHAAEDWKTLISFLVQFILQIETPEHAKYFDWVLWFFSPGKEWPDAIPLSMRIFIRALQVRILIMSGREYEHYDTDLEQLISAATDEDMLAVTAARFHTGAVLEQASPGLTARRAMEAAHALHSIEHKIPIKSPFPPEVLFWGATAKLKDREQIRPVIEVIKGMSEEERGVVFSSDIGPEMSIFFTDSCYAIEAAKEQATQNWTEVLAILGELQEIGRLPGAEPLYAAAVRARAIVLADFMKNADKALEVLTKFSHGLTNASSFVLISTKSSIILNKKRLEEAFDSFKEALAYKEGRRYRLLYFDTLRRGMLAASQTNHFEHAKAWCKSALNILHKEETGQVVAGREYQYDYIELLGELGWMLWKYGYPMKSCAAMYAIVQQLVKNDDIDNPRYKETFLKTGHVMGWLATVAYKGEPPSITVGGEEYMTPYPGIFCHRAPGITELPYVTGKNSFLLSQIAMMASGVGQLKLARKAYLLASEIAKKEGLLVYSTIMELEISSLNSYIGDYEAAFASLLAGIVGVPLTKKRGSLETKDNPIEVWEGLPVEEIIAIEHFHIYHLVILPAFAGLLKYNDKELCLQLVDKLQEAIGSVQEKIRTYDRSVSIINYMRLAFDTKDQRQNISDILRTLKPDDNYERLILYIALANQPSARLGEIANTQAIILPYVNETGAYGDFIRKSISEWIVKSWYEELENRSFRLNTPRNLQRALEGIPRTSDLVSDAARVLLAAEHSAGTTYNADVREKLIEMIKTE